MQPEILGVSTVVFSNFVLQQVSPSLHDRVLPTKLLHEYSAYLA